MSTIELENNIKLYPIKFTPILKQKIWGGEKLITSFNKNSKLTNLGESWEVSGIKENVSVVSHGIYKSLSLNDLIEEFKGDFLGSKIYNEYDGDFPLLFKFIDASENLSIQLHPNDELSKERHNSFGKTEMWYVLSSDDKAVLYAGFNKEIEKDSYIKASNSRKLLEVINKEKVEKGDAFFIESGTIHAIGKGVLLAEIQQTSDVTYRVYDWQRKGLDGKERELHTDLAIDAIDFSKQGSCEIKYKNSINQINSIYSCKYFTTNKLNIENDFDRNISNIDSFIVYMCIEGNATININETKEEISKGETVLIPAVCEKLLIIPDKKIELLEIYISLN